ncbi:uncharacterized protein SAPINGB_P001489 [Magnusiomyces paraingens]|uniref:Hyphally-regulated cell wall protein N-terminal domain-containing protein n=1 Tax=Magnusiomyces paraingens TaxID=2606893 RepID=A0A5E8B6J0_9ASCO|nr:uncharacterized protein SAPINGB_P001489 [Saprochaete ingens]VVT46990.1 unnamed protein product [Saprochaete ingens]
MKFFALASAFFALAQAEIQPSKSVQLSFTSTHERFVNRPLSSGSPANAIGFYPDSSTLFVGYQLPDGRIRVGGVDTWLTINSAKQLAVVSAQTTGPANFDVTSEGNLVFNGSDTFSILNESGNWIVYTSDATFPATAYIGPSVKIAVHYY